LDKQTPHHVSLNIFEHAWGGVADAAGGGSSSSSFGGGDRDLAVATAVANDYCFNGMLQ
jgi:hypothetical protein